MPALSQQQQKLFGLALAVKRGEVPRSEASDEVLDIVDSMSEKKIRDFAATSHSGLPRKVETLIRKTIQQEISKNKEKGNMKKVNELRKMVSKIIKEETEYQQFFKKALEKAGKSIPQMSDEEKKEFFNKIDSAWKGKGEKNEGNTSGAAVTKAKEEGDDEFTVDGKTYPVKESVNDIKPGDVVSVTRKDGKLFKGKVEKTNPLKIRTSASDTVVIGNNMIKSVIKESVNEYDEWRNTRTQAKNIFRMLRQKYNNNISDMKDGLEDILKRNKTKDDQAEVMRDEFNKFFKISEATLNHTGKKKELVNEGKYDVMLGRVENAVEKASSFMGIGAELKKAGIKYKFSTGMMAIYLIQVPGNTIGIVNKKYASDAEIEVGDYAIGLLEGPSNMMENNDLINEMAIRKGTKIRLYFDGRSYIVDYVVVDTNYFSNRYSGGKTNLLKVVNSTHPKIKVDSTEEFSSQDLKRMIKSDIASVIESKELKGNQYKLDVDGDGDIEADDLADLRAGKRADDAVTEQSQWSSEEQKMVNQIMKMKRGERKVYELPMKTQEFYRKHKDKFEPVNNKSVNEGVKGGKRYGDWTVTQYEPVKYDDYGAPTGGIIKLVNQKTFHDLLIQNDLALRGNKWFISVNRRKIENKNPEIVIQNAIKNWVNEALKTGDKLIHKHNPKIEIELIEPTNKGWKVYQIEKGKKKIAYFDKQDISGDKSLFESVNENFIPKVGTIDDFKLKDLLLKNPRVKELLSDKEMNFLKKNDTDVIKHQSKPFNMIATDGKLEFEMDLKKYTLSKPLKKARPEIISYYSTNKSVTEAATRRSTDFFQKSKHGAAIHNLLKGKWDRKKVKTYFDKMGDSDVKWIRILGTIANRLGVDTRKYKRGEELESATLDAMEKLYKTHKESVTHKKKSLSENFLHIVKRVLPDGDFIVDTYDGEAMSPKEAIQKMRISLNGYKAYKYKGLSSTMPEYKKWHSLRNNGNSPVETYKKMFKEVVTEAASRTAMEIGGLTGMNKDAVQKFVDTHNLDIEKVYQFVKKGKLSDRMDFVTAAAGKPGNPIQKKMIKMFKEAVNEKLETDNTTIREARHDGDLDKVEMAVKNASSFMGVGAELKKAGIKYKFSTGMMPIYTIEIPGNTIGIVASKYAAGAEREVNGIAIGLLK
jgi:hypothetical protein